jgi:hypothetical protein
MGEKMYLTGDTVRVYASFFDVNGNPKDPEIVKVKFYDYRYNLLEEFLISSSNKLAVGEYFFDYRTQNKEMRVYYEWYGEIAGNPVIDRDGFRTKFINR